MRDSLSLSVGLFSNEALGTKYVFLPPGSFVSRLQTMQATCCNPVFADSVTSCRTYPIVGFARQALSNLSFSFSGQTGESNNGDYQECGMSSMFMLEEPQCLTSCPESQLPSVSRDCAVLRYKEKRKLRK